MGGENTHMVNTYTVKVYHQFIRMGGKGTVDISKLKKKKEREQRSILPAAVT